MKHRYFEGFEFESDSAAYGLPVKKVAGWSKQVRQPKREPKHEEPEHEDVKALCEWLSYMRPAGSEAEQEFIERFLNPLRELPHVQAFQDEKGNLYLITDERSTTLFTAHTDSVHRQSGRQKVYHAKGFLEGVEDCLGADDGAGCWLLAEMVKAGVAGTFMFAREEEVGGLGSKYAASTFDSWLGSFDRVISFDRRGTSSVITHQSGLRCCSDDFATALGGLLGAEMPEWHKGFALDDGGSFTDSKNFTGLIAECTNLAVGYEHEHWEDEALDCNYLIALRDACVRIDWETLPTVREAGSVEQLNYGYGAGYYGFGEPVDRGYLSGCWEEKVGSTNAVTVDDLYEMDDWELEAFVADEPGQAARLMGELMYGR